jgi:hypothetical protein
MLYRRKIKESKEALIGKVCDLVGLYNTLKITQNYVGAALVHGYHIRGRWGVHMRE